MRKILTILIFSMLISCASTSESQRRTPLASLSEYGLDQTVNIRASRAQARKAKADGIELPVGNYRPKIAVAPNYPFSARNRGKTGWVLVAYDISTSGSVENIRVIDEYPKNIFSESALEAAAQFEFEPYFENGVAVPIPNSWNLFTYDLH